MTTILLAIALVLQLSSGKAEAEPLKCFDLDEGQRVCIEEEGDMSAAPTNELPVIDEIEKVAYYNI
ncbi:hypothetical protein A2392_02350 [Candidatus Kaiserbacteria bacterium RIFOXYB1_FULL_46_14]|uniref:Uncharacterized protein n=1 Tax=Candidatus Kaiserbacteria bacterium RIFOXYB1_FULL_46_14 TaxID=1798531 RepID=A0A1F6FIB9_9BACT|nr:MAG: hypothetical protein A2392_02350 [Candidatus Kaiserbacteria bacterium RIFOXYB1_FULL_46_14]